MDGYGWIEPAGVSGKVDRVQVVVHPVAVLPGGVVVADDRTLGRGA